MIVLLLRFFFLRNYKGIWKPITMTSYLKKKNSILCTIVTFFFLFQVVFRLWDTHWEMTWKTSWTSRSKIVDAIAPGMQKRAVTGSKVILTLLKKKATKKKHSVREEGVCVVEKLVTVSGPLVCVSPLVHTGFTSALCGTVTVIFL